MATLSADTKRDFKNHEIDTFNELPVIASDIIYEGAAVGESGITGTLRPLVAGDTFHGFARRRADNSSGSASAINVLIQTRGVVELAVTGASSAADIGATVYASDDDTFTLTQGGNSPVGRVERWISGTTCDVYFEGDAVRSLPSSEAAEEWSPGSAQHGFFEDFIKNSLDSDLFVATATDAGSATISDGVTGVVTLAPSDGTVADNDEIYLHQTAETVKFAASKPFWFEARVKVTEANVDDANVAIGLKDAWGANSLQDNGAGPAASYSGALFFKVDGGTVWQAEASIGTTQDTDTSVGSVDGSYHVYRIEFDPGSGVTDGTVRFLLDGSLVHTVSSFDYTSATDMECGVGVKNGGANNESVDVDYIAYRQVR